MAYYLLVSSSTQFGAVGAIDVLPSESSWSYWAGVAWLLFAGIGTIFATILAIFIFGLPIAACIWAFWMMPAVFFANCFLSLRSQAGAALATVLAALCVVPPALGNQTGLALIALMLEAISLLGFIDLRREAISRRTSRGSRPALR